MPKCKIVPWEQSLILVVCVKCILWTETTFDAKCKIVPREQPLILIVCVKCILWTETTFDAKM